MTIDAYARWVGWVWEDIAKVEFWVVMNKMEESRSEGNEVSMDDMM